MEIEKQILYTALEHGAQLAGIVNFGIVKTSPSHLLYTKMGYYSGVGSVGNNEKLPENKLFNYFDSTKSILIIGLSHPAEHPELDWWDGKGGTPGNRILIDIIDKTQQLIEKQLNISTKKLHYHVEKGGIFLKDAAVLAGLGCIGKNNLLITPEYGPRVRLRALFIDAELESGVSGTASGSITTSDFINNGGPSKFDPCTECEIECTKSCPENAMDEKAPIFAALEDITHLPARNGWYDRIICNIQLEKDVEQSKQSRESDQTGHHKEKPISDQQPIKYCRTCEFVCPVGENRA